MQPSEEGLNTIDEMPAERLLVRIRPHRVGVVLAVIVIAVGAAYAATKLIQAYYDPVQDFGLFRFFHLGQEANLPSYVSALLILCAGVLTVLIGYSERVKNGRFKWHWVILGVGLVFMSFDEAAQIHDEIVGPLSRAYIGSGEGIFYFGWYIPFIPVLIILLVLYLPFLRSLPRKYSVLFFLAGAVFVGGAVGVEMIQSYISFHGITGGAMALSLLIEEMCEMMGMVIMIYALLSFMADRKTDILLSVERSRRKMKVAE